MKKTVAVILINRAVAVCVLACAAALTASAQTGAAKFRHQPRKVEVGAVYHYLKTNVDGTKPEHVSVYVAAGDRIESFKFHPRAARAALVIATMDWSSFSAKRLESWQVFRDDKKLFATLDYLPAERAVNVSIPPLGKPDEKTAIKHLPFHVYNFDLSSLNFAFRHLKDPRATFTVGLADPTFKPDPPLFFYRGEATVRYVGEETRNNVACRKYSIDGDGLSNRGGLIWVNKRGGYFEDVEIALPDNPEWQSFKFKLERVERMTRAQWEAFMKAQF